MVLENLTVEKKNLAKTKKKFVKLPMLLNFVKLGGLRLFGATISWVEISLGGSFPCGNYSRWEFSG